MACLLPARCYDIVMEIASRTEFKFHSRHAMFGWSPTRKAGLANWIKIVLRLRRELAVDGVPEIHCVGDASEAGLANAGAEKRNPTGAEKFICYILPADDVIDLVDRYFPVPDVEEAILGNDAFVGEHVFEVERFKRTGKW